MNKLVLRVAKQSDLIKLENVERRCFAPVRRSSRRALQRSIASPHQYVWLAESRSLGKRETAGVIVLRRHPLSLRIYSIAVMPTFRGQGVGQALIKRAMREARRQRRLFVTLEADLRDASLIRWYEKFGFEKTRRLLDYYAPGRHAWRMRCRLPLRR